MSATRKPFDPSERPGARWRRFVIQVLLPGLVLSAVLMVGIHLSVRPVYEADALLKVEPSSPGVFENHRAVRDEPFGQFLANQAELIRSPNVLSAALSSPRIASMPRFRNSADAEGELRRLIQVRVLPNTALLRVSMSSATPDDCAEVVNAVDQAYLAASNEWSYGMTRAQIKSLEDYERELNAKILEQQQLLMDLAQRVDDAGSRSNPNGHVSKERLSRFLADYDAAVTARIKTDAELEAEKSLQAKTEPAKVRQAARLDELEVRLRADLATEKALLDRVQSAQSTSRADELKKSLVQKELKSLHELKDTVSKQLEQLRLETRGEARVHKVSEARAAAIPVSDPRRALMAAAPVAVFAMLFGFSWLRRRSARKDDFIE
jgi:uncharacterized protein involved in exopolysaccharide biosynthesis